MQLRKIFFVLIPICLMGFIHRIQAQTLDSAGLRKVYEQETIYLLHNNRTFVKAGKEYKAGTAYRKLAKEFSNSPDALLALREYKRVRLQGSLMLLASPIPFFIAVASPTIRPPLNIILYGSALGLYYGGLATSISSQKHLERAVWLYNRDVLLQEIK